MTREEYDQMLQAKISRLSRKWVYKEQQEKENKSIYHPVNYGSFRKTKRIKESEDAHYGGA